MMIATVLLLQAATLPPDPLSADQPAAPALEINVRAKARSVEIEQGADARVELEAGSTARIKQRVQRSKPAGESSYRNLEVDYRMRVLLEDPQASSARPPSPASSNTIGTPQ